MGPSKYGRGDNWDKRKKEQKLKRESWKNWLACWLVCELKSKGLSLTMVEEFLDIRIL